MDRGSIVFVELSGSWLGDQRKSELEFLRGELLRSHCAAVVPALKPPNRMQQPWEGLERRFATDLEVFHRNGVAHTHTHMQQHVRHRS